MVGEKWITGLVVTEERGCSGGLFFQIGFGGAPLCETNLEKEKCTFGAPTQRSDCVATWADRYNPFRILLGLERHQLIAFLVFAEGFIASSDKTSARPKLNRLPHSRRSQLPASPVHSPSPAVKTGWSWIPA